MTAPVQWGLASDLRASSADSVRTLNPGYFALVMATGIVSVGIGNQGLSGMSLALLWITAVAYAVLVVLTGWRVVAFRADTRADFTDPARAFGFFTFIAGTDLLGTRLSLAGHHGTAYVLLAVGAVGWISLGYVVPWTALLSRSQRPLLATANGTWFLWVVATQSVAVLAAALEPTSSSRSGLAVLAVFAWSVGALLYAATGIFVTIRMLTYPLTPADLTPPYWVAMGATAITVLAGARIVQMADAPMVDATRGLIAGVSVVFWAFGTWLIPVLVAAGWWRHVTHRVPLRYEPALWSFVFPLGMYGVAGHYLGLADHLGIVTDIGHDETWVALAAWALTFAAMLAHLGGLLWRRPLEHGLRSPSETAPGNGHGRS